MYWDRIRCERKLVKGMPVKDKEESSQLIGRGESSDLTVGPACEVKDRKGKFFVERASDSSTAEKILDITLGRPPK